MVNKPLSQKIISLFNTDQKLRKDSSVSISKLQKIDRQTTSFLKKAVEDIGWPSVKKVGKKASYAAWIIVQHTADITFAKKCLVMMKKDAAVDKKQIAFLTDKILVTQKKKQIYGTIVETKVINGKYVTNPMPIRDEKNIDERRKLVGLESLKHQLQNNTRIYKKYFAGRK